MTQEVKETPSLSDIHGVPVDELTPSQLADELALHVYSADRADAHTLGVKVAERIHDALKDKLDDTHITPLDAPSVKPTEPSLEERMGAVFRNLTSDTEREAFARDFIFDGAKRGGELQVGDLDEVTGIPGEKFVKNRLLGIYERMKRESEDVETEQRQQSKRIIAFVDIDQFKQVNDTYKHRGGNAVLLDVAARLLDVTRDGDLVARLHGDEFVVIAEFSTDEDGEEASAAYKQRIESAFEDALTPHTMRDGEDVEIEYGVTVGAEEITLDDFEDTRTGELVAKLTEGADTDMYREKHAGRKGNSGRTLDEVRAAHGANERLRRSDIID